MMNEKIRTKVYNELRKEYDDAPFTLPNNEDLRPILKGKSVASADVVVLYSSSLKANKYRSRRFRTGSSSIYLSNKLGGEQKGVMVHTIGIKGRHSFYKSIPLTRQEYLTSDLDKTIPRNTPLFTDEGYKFIWDRKNHKMVNHSKKSKNPRYNLSRERWVSKEGVTSNIAEGRNNLLKGSFRSYGYISPKWSQAYLSEISFYGNLRFEEGLARLLFTGFGESGDASIVGKSDALCGRRDLNSSAFLRI
ncbi:MAG: transposase [Leptospira sp.]|nr:transposase [Leptospira sp.]